MDRREAVIDRILRLVQLLLLAAVAVLFCKLLLRPLLLPAAAFLLSGLIAKPAERLHHRVGLSTGLWALLLTAAVMTGLGLIGWGCYRFFAAQLEELMAALPDFLSNLQESLLALQHKYFQGKSGNLIPELQISSLDLAALADPLGKLASTLPDALLTVVFTLAATVLFAGRREAVLSFLKRQLPPRTVEALSRLRGYLKEAAMGWLKAQGILAAVTTALLLAGFLLLRVKAAPLLALTAGLLDALPLLGTGVVLLPWALACLLLGDGGRAAGLAALFALTCTVRNLLEPQVVGRQLGLDPLLSLLGVWLGWRLAGLAGMILAPAALLVLVKLREWGYSKFWR